MLDIKRIRNHPEEVVEGLKKRHGDYPIDKVLELDKERRDRLQEMENMKAEQNKVSKQVPQMKKEGKDVSSIFEEMKELGQKAKDVENTVREIEDEIQALLLDIPNVPAEDVPEGVDDSDNIEVRRVGEQTKFDYEPKAHWDLGVDLNILDWERASKITGTRFTIFKGKGATLERALINFMLNLHTSEHGFREISPPFMVNRDSMIGTGQLPKFEHDMFHLPSKDYFLIPTAEVPLTNLYRDEMISEEELPIYVTGYTPCFRQEAGSAGRDTRGVIRNHQFDKVELVKFVKPGTSYDELEKLTASAERILQELKLPYRVVTLSTGDLGFSSAKTYDIEVWMPSYEDYVEISSCSNFEDFQARRANLKYRDEETGKPEFLHTLNGSGLAVGRALAAVLENYQQPDGSVKIPEVLRPYFGGEEYIKAEESKR